MNMSDEFFSVVTAIFLLRGFGITLLIAVFTIFFSFLIGSILGVAKFQGKGIAAKVSSIYIIIVLVNIIPFRKFNLKVE